MTETHALIRCDEAPVPENLTNRSWSYQGSLASRGPSPTLSLHAQSLAGTVLSTINPHAADLVRIASYVYAADQMISRGGTADVYGQKWRRHLALCIPVAQPEFWMQDALRSRLNQVLSFLTDDAWEFHFSQAPDETRQITLDLEDQPLLGTPDTVVLFSGGADSLCTAIEAVAHQNRRPVLISHRPAPHVNARQKRLTALLRERFPDWAVPHLSFWIHRKGSDAPDTSQRSRSFLFASLGAAIAAELEISKVLLGDNGVVSLNLPINAQLVGALASRSTHPKFIHLVNAFLAEVFAERIEVINPLATRTRAEVLDILTATNSTDLLQETNSCSHTRNRPAATPHCGYCSQCVDRRFGSLAADLEEHDLGERYEVNLFTDTLREGEPRTIAESYVRFAREVNQTHEEELFNMFPQLFDCILPNDAAPDQTASELTSLLKRHAANVLQVVAMMIARNQDQLAANTLPNDCLLRLVTGSTLERQSHNTTDDNVFRRDGQKWTVTYQGMTQIFNHAKGMAYIARLLAHPGHEFHALDLARERPPSEEPIDMSQRLSLLPEGLVAADLGVGGGYATEPILDSQARKEYREQLAHLKDQRSQLVDSQNHQQIATLDEAIGFLEQELKTTTGLSGRARTFSSSAERARKAVSRNVRRSLKNIAAFHPQLHTHLESSIKTGMYCSYRQNPASDWTI